MSTRNPSSETTSMGYKIQLSRAQLWLLGTLGTLSLLVSFYLGLITGQKLYEPVSKTASTPPVEPQESYPEELQFFELGKASLQQEEPLDTTFSKIDSLKTRTQEIVKKQAPPIKNVPSDINTEAKQPPLQKSLQPKAPPKPPTTQRNVPSISPTQITGAGDYTIQVFSSQNLETADTFLKRLRQNGFPNAYIHTYLTPQQKTLYRVRVGRMSYEEAQQQMEDVQRLEFIDAVQVMKAQ